MHFLIEPRESDHIAHSMVPWACNATCENENQNLNERNDQAQFTSGPIAILSQRPKEALINNATYQNQGQRWMLSYPARHYSLFQTHPQPVDSQVQSLRMPRAKQK